MKSCRRLSVASPEDAAGWGAAAAMRTFFLRGRPRRCWVRFTSS